MIRGKKKLFVSALAIAVCCMGVSSVKAEERNGKVLTIYKNEDSLSDVSENGKEIGKITCSTNDCKVVTEIQGDTAAGYTKAIFSNGYVVVEENKKYVVYNYTNDAVVYGPYGKVTEKPFEEESNGKPLFYYSDWDYGKTKESKLYAIGIDEESGYSVYSFLTGKKISNIKGDVRFAMVDSTLMFDVNDFVFRNMIVTWNNKTATFISLETGEKLYSIDDLYEMVWEDGDIYLETRTSSDMIKLYDINGNLLFENIAVGYSVNVLEKVNERWMVVVKGREQFKIYSNNKEIKTSKKYSEVLGVTEYKDKLYALVLDGKDLNLIDEEDKVVTTLSKNKEKVTGVNGHVLTVENGVFHIRVLIDYMEEDIYYDYKNSITANKTCPNDSKIDITACITSGKTEEDCILIHCPGAGKVENPKTGMYVTAVLILSCITGLVLFVLKGMNYLKRM